MLATLRAGRCARAFVLASRRDGGGHRLPPWPAVAPTRRRGATRAARAVTGLRLLQRASLGFLGLVEDALYLTAGLRRLGFAASFHLGRELAPAVAPGGFHAWVRCDGRVVSTSLPVDEEYVPVHASPG
jgi:hypothetical protein